MNIIITNITRISCLEARCVCRQAAVKAAKIVPLVGLARSKQDPNQPWARCSVFIPPPASRGQYICPARRICLLHPEELEKMYN